MADNRRLGLRMPGPRASAVPPLAAVLQTTPLVRPSALAHMSWTAEVSGAFDVLGNDTHGDCAVVAAAQLVRIATAVCGQERRPTLDAVMETYSELSGYVPGKPETDTGVEMTDLLAMWKGPGLKLFGAGPRETILGYLAINWRDPAEMAAAIGLFPGLLFGFNLPAFADSNRPIWSAYLSDLTAADFAPVGGHATASASCGPEGFTQITWGEFRLATPAFVHAYCMEAYAPVMPEWAMPDGLLPAGVTRASAESTIKELAAKAA